MNLHAIAINAVERTEIPDSITRAGIEYLVGRTKRKLARAKNEETAFATEMQRFPIATHTDEANQQHYEVPAAFFARVLGNRRKYSCCLYPTRETTLDEAELHALAETVDHAAIHDGQSILELGCGWGSLSLYMAESFPHARITSVSNSASQRQYIEQQAAERGLSNLTVVTADMNEYTTNARHDRIVSVEMFEHMSNWQELLKRARGWLKPDGRLFLHVFTHKDHSYRFDHSDPADWIANYFFTGGIMPAHDLPHRFPESFRVEQEWRWSGEHYRRTAMDWLANFDRQTEEIDAILTQVYGKSEARIWRRRWRLFFLATAGLFGHAGGDVWGVGHYLLAPAGG